MRMSLSIRPLLISITSLAFLAFTGCNEGDGAADAGGGSAPAPTTTISTGSTPAPGGGAGAPPPEAPNIPAEPPPVIEGVTSKEGLALVGEDGKTLDTQAGLQRAVEYYTRELLTRVPVDEEEEKRFKPVPPLTDLQQLVTYKVIRAIPPAPAGKKWAYDAQAGKVILQ